MKRNAWIATGAAGIILIAGGVTFAMLRNQDDGMKAAVPPEIAAGAKGPKIVSVTPNAPQVGLYDKFELSVGLEADVQNPYDPEQADLQAVFSAPGGKEWHINGFYDGTSWRIRFAPDEKGTWRYRVAFRDREGAASGGAGSFEAIASDRHGPIRVAGNKRYLQFADGASYYGVGVAYPWNITESGLDRIAENGGNAVTYWNGNYDGEGSGGGTEQLESTADGIGKINAAKGQRIDEIVGWLEARDMRMNFVVWPHDSLADKLTGWPAQWDKNAFSELGPAADFFSSDKMWDYQEKLYRYIIARWGYSRAIATWDLVDEITGTDGYALGDKAAADGWIDKVHAYFAGNDPFGHPTMGSMAGNIDDYWDHGYRTMSISDRENYYDLSVDAYAADISKRWAQYEKPLYIGETGNVDDVNTYHDALWASLSNGLASTPIWWDVTKVNEAMYGQMKALADFVRGIDFNEPRHPVRLDAKTVDVKLSAEHPLEDGRDISDWDQPIWADANLDENSSRYEPAFKDRELVTGMRFATGKFSQGFLQQKLDKSDWSAYPRLSVDLFVDAPGKSTVKARPVLFPGGKWTEGSDASDVVLAAGKWVTLRVPLRDAPAGYWKDASLSPDDLKGLTGWGIKIYADSSSADAKMTTVKVRNPRLISDQAPTVSIPEARGWLMKGEREAFGWMLAGQGAVGGKTAKIPEFGTGGAAVSWYDPWKGKTLAQTNVRSENGDLTITAPPSDNPDIAFLIRKEP